MVFLAAASCLENLLHLNRNFDERFLCCFFWFCFKQTKDKNKIEKWENDVEKMENFNENQNPFTRHEPIDSKGEIIIH